MIDTVFNRFLSPGQFEDRLYSMEQAYRDMTYEGGDDEDDDDDDDDEGEQTTSQGTDSGQGSDGAEDTDPFSHGPADVVIGTVKIPLDGIAYNQQDEDDFFIKDHSEKSRGTLEIMIQPCNADRSPTLEFREQPEELVCQPLYFELTLKRAHLKEAHRTSGMKIVYSHPNLLGGKEIKAEGHQITDDKG